MKDYTIGKAGWHTRKDTNWTFDPPLVYACFKSIINYLQGNKLTTKEILSPDEEATDETQIMASDLTEVGLLFVKAVFDKWIDKVLDEKILPTDYRLLDKALAKINGNS